MALGNETVGIFLTNLWFHCRIAKFLHIRMYFLTSFKTILFNPVILHAKNK